MAISSKFILFIRKRFIRKLRFRQKKKRSGFVMNKIHTL